MKESYKVKSDAYGEAIEKLKAENLSLNTSNTQATRFDSFKSHLEFNLKIS